jgi:hypothetical protein
MAISTYICYLLTQIEEEILHIYLIHMCIDFPYEYIMRSIVRTTIHTVLENTYPYKYIMRSTGIVRTTVPVLHVYTILENTYPRS